MTEQAKKAGQSEEQIQYAAILNIGSRIGLALLVITYLIYITGVLPPYVSMETLTTLWSLPTAEYLHNAQVEPGWFWFSQLKHGDFLNFISIAILAFLSVICYLSILPGLLKRKDRIYAFLVIAEVVVLVLAASGIVVGGH